MTFGQTFKLRPKTSLISSNVYKTNVIFIPILGNHVFTLVGSYYGSNMA